MKAASKQSNLVVLLGANVDEAKAICQIIKDGPYRTAICTDLAELKSMLAASCLAVILDVDSVALDNRTIRALTLAYPATCFLCASKERYHPDLQDAICYHLFACLHKPINPDELHYFLRCIRDDLTGSRGPPNGRD